MTKKENSLKPRFVLLCDYAFTTSDNKLSIIGEFDSLMGAAGVATLTQGFVVGSFDIVGSIKEGRVLVKFLDNYGNNFSPNKELVFHGSGAGGRINLLVKLINLQFTQAGRYTIQFCDIKGKPLASTFLDVSFPSVVRE